MDGWWEAQGDERHCSLKQNGVTWLQYLASPPLETSTAGGLQKQERCPQNRTLGVLHLYANQLTPNSCFDSHTVMIPRTVISVPTTGWAWELGSFKNIWLMSMYPGGPSGIDGADQRWWQRSRDLGTQIMGNWLSVHGFLLVGVGGGKGRVSVSPVLFRICSPWEHLVERFPDKSITESMCYLLFSRKYK